MRSSKKPLRVTWVTFNAFFDTDYYMVRELSDTLDITWYVVKSSVDRLDNEAELLSLERGSSVVVHRIVCGRRLRSPSCIGTYFRLLDTIRKSEQPDVLYTTLAGAPYYVPLLCMMADRQNTILAIHNVHVPKGGAAERFFRLYTWIGTHGFDYYHVFSRSQLNVLKAISPRCKALLTPLASKDFGSVTGTRSDRRITFLSFGHIKAYKRVDVLIEAAQRAYERTRIDFRVIVAGTCDDWAPYERLIRYRSIFDLRIGHVDNADIPNLLNETDYFVTPYQDIAQSGSAMIAINYGKPVIASRLPAFEEIVEDGETGFLFPPADVEALANLMENILQTHQLTYPMLHEKAAARGRTLYAPRAVAGKYAQFFEGVAENNAFSRSCG